MSAAVHRGVPGNISLSKVQNDMIDDFGRIVFNLIELKSVVFVF